MSGKHKAEVKKMFGRFGVDFVIDERSPTDKDDSPEMKAAVAVANAKWAEFAQGLKDYAVSIGLPFYELCKQQNCERALVCGCGEPTKLGRSAGRNKVKKTPAFLAWEKAGGYASGKAKPKNEFHYEINPNYLRWYTSCNIDKKERNAKCRGTFLSFLDATNTTISPASPFTCLVKKEQELLVDPAWKEACEMFIQSTTPGHKPDWTTRRMTENTQLGFGQAD